MSKPLLFRTPTLTQLWHKACEGLLFATQEELGWQAGATTGRYDVLAIADSMEYDFDVGLDLWLTGGRFTKLQRDYLDYDILPLFVDRAASMDMSMAKRGTVTQMNCAVHKEVINQGGRKKNNYKWGNCIFGFSFRPAVGDQKAIVAMHSRTSYVSYMGGLDLALAYTIARTIAEARGEDVKEYGFRWMADTLQWYSIKSMSYIHRYDLVDEIFDTKMYPSDKYPTCKITRNSYDFLYKRLRNEEPPKYGPTLRIWQLLFNIKKRPPSLPVDNLSLEALK